MSSDEHSITIQVTNSMSQRLQKVSHLDSREAGRPTIHRIPHDVRVDDNGAYSPKIISIGPYHHNKQTLQPMEALKWEYLRDILARSPSNNNNLSTYVSIVTAQEAKARARYSDQIGLEPHEFVEMLVLDGCFILEFLIRRTIRKMRGESLGTEKRNLPLFRHDLLLLENQIPFFIMEILFDATDHVDDIGLPGLTFVDLAINHFTKGKLKKETIMTDDCEVHHLLHLHHLCLVKGIDRDYSSCHNATIKAFCWPILSVLMKLRRLIYLLLISFLYFLVTSFQSLILRRPISFPRRRPSEANDAKPTLIIPSATELEEAGVVFERREKTCYTDVLFEEGHVRMPFLPLEPNTISEFRNLLAFEQLYANSGNDFASYVTFLCNVISSGDDVAILRRCGIIENKIGSDKEVAQFFNNLRGITNLNMKKRHYLSDLFEKLNKYYELDHHRWRATLVHDHFSNPWAIISLVAGVVLLVLTALQTVYTIHS